MSEPAYYWNFTRKCHTCEKPVQYSDGRREFHPCPEDPALVIEGCNADTPLAERVEQALADHELLNESQP